MKKKLKKIKALSLGFICINKKIQLLSLLRDFAVYSLMPATTQVPPHPELNQCLLVFLTSAEFKTDRKLLEFIHATIFYNLFHI